MDYSKIGHRLKLVRERKGLSYEQIFEITRIQPSILKDIEEGKTSVSPVFLKGFIKTYARSLGQDAEDLFKEAETKDAQEDTNAKEIKESNENNESKKRNYLKHLWPLLGLFIVFQVAIWIVNTSKKSSEEDFIMAEDESPHPEGKAVESIKPETQENIEATIQTENITEKDQTLFHKIKNSVFTEDLLIKSSEVLEIYFKVDKKSTVTKRLEPSLWFHIKAKESIYLRFDENRGYVQIFHNGKQVPFENTPFFERTFQ